MKKTKETWILISSLAVLSTLVLPMEFVSQAYAQDEVDISPSFCRDIPTTAGTFRVCVICPTEGEVIPGLDECRVCVTTPDGVTFCRPALPRV
jgi:hypothetical protein